MSKRKKGSVPVALPKKEKKITIDMNKANLAKEYIPVTFKTGRHMTAKDRPRKKDWKREYEKESPKFRDFGDSFLFFPCYT